MGKEFWQLLFLVWFFDSWGFWWGSQASGTLMELRAATGHGLGTALGLLLVLLLARGMDRAMPHRSHKAMPIGQVLETNQDQRGLHVRMHITNEKVLEHMRSRQPNRD